MGYFIVIECITKVHQEHSAIDIDVIALPFFKVDFKVGCYDEQFVREMPETTVACLDVKQRLNLFFVRDTMDAAMLAVTS